MPRKSRSLSSAELAPSDLRPSKEEGGGEQHSIGGATPTTRTAETPTGGGSELRARNIGGGRIGPASTADETQQLIGLNTSV